MRDSIQCLIAAIPDPIFAAGKPTARKELVIMLNAPNRSPSFSPPYLFRHPVGTSCREATFVHATAAFRGRRFPKLGAVGRRLPAGKHEGSLRRTVHYGMTEEWACRMAADAALPGVRERLLGTARASDRHPENGVQPFFRDETKAEGAVCGPTVHATD